MAACAIFVNPYLRGDGNGYYAYVRSVVIDHDLKFSNEFDQGDPAFQRSIGEDPSRLETRPGYIRNQWSVGPSVLWTPFFLVGHAIATLSGRWPTNGFSFPYRWMCAFGTALYSVIGLWFAWRAAKETEDRTSATIAAIAVLGATSLPVYAFFLPFWGLGLATFPAAILVWIWSRGPSWTPERWAKYGFLAGFATTTHPIGVSWLALLGVAWFRDKGTTRDRLLAGLASAVGFATALSPQFVIRAIAHGNAFDLGYGEPFDWLHPDIAAELVTGAHGLFTWTPLALIAVGGLILLTRRGDRLGIGLLITFVVMVLLVGAKVVPEQSSFGNRMFVHFTPGFVIGTTAAVAWARARAKRLSYLAVGALVVWNSLFAFQWAWGLLPKRGSIDWSQMARQQFTTAPRELGSVAVRFFTDRQGLIDEVQSRDEQRLLEGSDRAKR